jgi:(S)-2-hydroxyglutarate dehydrogenase
MSAKFDIAIVGGGIVGTATAMALAEQGHRSVVVLEAEEQLAAHQTGHNSGVIHSGLYYRPGSLKAQFCREGRDLMYEFCARENIRHERCGKLVVATRPAEIERLDVLEQRGRANGLEGMKRLRAEELKEYEPSVRGVAGLWVPHTGIVDYTEVTQAFARRIRAAGGEIRTSTRLQNVREMGGRNTLMTTSGDFDVRMLVNCGGLQSDRIARMAGADPGVRIIPFRGEYYFLTEDRRSLIRNLVYPVPDPALPFLGVHFTRTVDGLVEAGPNAVLALKREGYRWRDISLRDLRETITFAGFWKMARVHWKNGGSEMLRSMSKQRFVRSLQELVPSLRSEDVNRGGSGVRAQAVDRTGKLVDDFHLVRTPRAVHVLNAPSPAATASIAIGRSIAQHVNEQLA